MEPFDLTGFAILFILTLQSLFENNKHHYPDISGVLGSVQCFVVRKDFQGKNRKSKKVYL